MRKWVLVASVAGLACGGMAEARAPRFAATVVRTAYGIPHVRAANWSGIGYGVGYAYAQDNLCMIAEQFATVAGQRSLYFGPKETTAMGAGRIDNLSSDIFFRSVIDLPALRRGMHAQGPEATQLIAGYIAGYNRLLRDLGPTRVPAGCRGKPWVRPITLDDSLRLNEAVMSLASAFALAPAIVGAAPPGAPHAMATPAGFPDPQRTAIGSNGWAFGGDVTRDGRGLLVGNPHFPWNGPGRFWEMHVTIPGKIDVMGAGLAGSPLPTLGFNHDIAWTHTVTAAQHFTIFQMKIDPADPTAYLIDGKSEKMGRKTVSVPMPDGAAPVERTLYTTRFGPMLAMPAVGLTWSKTQGFSFRDANKGNQRALGTWVAIGQARNAGDVRAAVERTLGIPWVNTIVADRNGDILHADVTAAPNVSIAKAKDCATPLSAFVAQRAVLLDGTRSACDWDNSPGTPVAGLLPASEQAVYARRDYLANSNDSYWLSNPKAPHAILSPVLGPAATERTLRTRSGLIEIERRLSGTDGFPGKQLDRDVAKRMVFANHSLAAELVMDPLLTLCRDGAKPDERIAAACTALGGWDRKFNLDSKGAYLFSTFWLAAQKIPGLWAVKFDVADPVHTPRDLIITGETGAKLTAALAAAAAQLGTEKIALDARWGDVQFAMRGAERIPIHGGDGLIGVLNVAITKPAPGGVELEHGTSYVQIVGFDAAGPIADAVLSYSQSTDPASPYFADQTRLYSAKGWHRLPFTPAQIAADGGNHPIRLSE
ncbi:penicillin acylase family protein [Sphingomonas sp. ERG5]|uniref:penicillin acylase family protein n=1 Tax=Sphingomonas sp. ERG5 TaxID=1381597 RepID=UPI00054C1DD1|nr:penicillin acylase family protein [Sphingomonas sp. ERG5]